MEALAISECRSWKIAMIVQKHLVKVRLTQRIMKNFLIFADDE